MRIITCAVVFGITLIGTPSSALTLEDLPRLPSATCHTDDMSEAAKSNLLVLIEAAFQRNENIYFARDDADRTLVAVMAREINGHQDQRLKNKARTYSGCLVENDGVGILWVPAPPDLISNLETQQ